MSSNIVDAIASGVGPADISQEIKDSLFGKTAERIDTYRQVASARLFGSEESEAEEEVEVEHEEE